MFGRSQLNPNEHRTELNFAIIDEVSQLAVGTTSYYRVVPEHKRLELGMTWLGRFLKSCRFVLLSPEPLNRLIGEIQQDLLLSCLTICEAYCLLEVLH